MFPEEVLQMILCGPVADIPRCMSVRPDLPEEYDDDSSRRYHMISHNFCPTDLGIPSKRRRKYTCFHLAPFVRISSDRCRFEDIFYRGMQTNASIYLDAVPAEVRASDLKNMIESRRGQRQRTHDESLCVEECMTSGDFDRLDGFKLLAGRKGLRKKDGTWLSPVALANIHQRAEYQDRICSRDAPALLTGSVLFDLIKNEPVGATSHWLIQGFPHPQVFGPAESAFFPCSLSLVDSSCHTSLSVAEQKTLTGNAMHLAAVGSWAMYNIACMDRSCLSRIS